MVIIMWCQIVKLSPSPNDTFALFSARLADQLLAGWPAMSERVS